MRKHYLNILGLSEPATESEIKRAYRKKAMQFHPDRNSGANAQEMFIKVTEAYDYLTSAPAKNIYKKKETKSKTEQERDDFYERMKRAKNIYEERQKAEQKIRDAKFKRFQNTILYKTSRPIVLFSYALYFLLLVDASLSPKPLDGFVSNFKKINFGYDYSFNTTVGKYEAHFDEIVTPYYARKGKRIKLNITPILNDLKSVHFHNNVVSNTKSVHYYSILIFFSLLFTIPGFVVRNSSIQSYLAVHLSYIVSILIIIFILSKTI